MADETLITPPLHYAPPPLPSTMIAAPGEGTLARACCGLGAAGWAMALLWIAWGGPPFVRVLGPAWAALGALWPTGYFISLALAFPWFGDQPGSGPHICLLELGLMGLVGGYLVRRALGRVVHHPNRLDPWITLFVAYSWLTLLPVWRWLQCELLFWKHDFLFRIMNHYGTAEVYGLQLALKLTLGAGLYAALRDAPALSTRRLRVLWATLAVALTLTALAGWLNLAGWLPLAWWRGINPDVTRFGYARLQSLFGHSGWLAQYFEVVAPAVLAGGLMARRARVRWPLLGLALFLFITQLFTMQRAGWIGLTGGYACVCVLALAGGEQHDAATRRRLLWCVLLPLTCLLVLGFAAALASPVFRHRLGELALYRHRTGIWSVALTIFRRSPLVGVGLGNYCHTHQQLFPPENPLWFQDKINAHNLYLNLAVERGVLGLLLFLVILAGLFWQGMRAGLGRAAGPLAGERWLWLGLTGGLVALALDGLFQYFFFLFMIEVLFWFSAGLLTLSGDEGARPAACHRRWAWAAVFLMLAGTVFWVHRDAVFAKWLVFIDNSDNALYIGGKQACLPVPPDARSVNLHVGTIDPASALYPVTLTVSCGGEVLRQVVMNKRERIEMALDIPIGHRPDEPLLITVSRTWNPWAYAMLYYPFPQIGVLYFPEWQTHPVAASR